MPISRYRPGARSLALLVLAAPIGCEHDAPSVTRPPVLTTVAVSVPTASLELGQIITATATGFDQDGAPIAIDAVTWSAVEPSIAAVDPGGTVFALSLGTTEITATVEGKVGRQVVAVTKAPAIRVNEIAPHTDTRAGWIELFNLTPADVDLSGWTLTDSDIFVDFKLPAGTSIPAGGYLVLDEVSLPFRVDADDAAHLFSRFGVQADGAAWTIDPATAFGRCPDGTGDFVTLTTRTKGAANACRPAGTSLGITARP